MFVKKREELMRKIIVMMFDDAQETDLEELLFLLESKGYIGSNNNFSANNLEYDNLIIGPKSRTVKRDGNNIDLTNYEFDILYLLAKSPGQVFSKEQIYKQVWKEPYYGAEDNVMSLIRRIRKKIEPDPAKPIYILTVWGIGYKFNIEMVKK